MNRKRQPATPAERGRATIPLLTVLFALVIVAFILGQRLIRGQGGLGGTAVPAAPSAEEAATAEPAQEAGSSRQVVPQQPETRRKPARPEPNANLGPRPSGDSAVARQVIASLSQIDLSQGNLTPAQGQYVRQAISQLVAQGAAAVPAIREFLEKNQDLSLGEAGSKLAGVPSMRAGLLEALRQIGGPDALDASRQVLQVTADPLELALAARNIEEAAPGQNREDILKAAREILATAADRKLPGTDLAPVFQVLQAFGDAGVADDFIKAAPIWDCYAKMALANLPGGEGIPSLVKLVNDPGAPGGVPDKFALRMLAQLSPSYPEAASALLDAARQNELSEGAWKQVAEALGGNQCQYVRKYPDNTVPQDANKFIPFSADPNQKQLYYSMPLPKDLSPAEADQRRVLIDQLLAATASNSAGAQALQQARARLKGR